MPLRSSLHFNMPPDTVSKTKTLQRDISVIPLTTEVAATATKNPLHFETYILVIRNFFKKKLYAFKFSLFYFFFFFAFFLNQL